MILVEVDVPALGRHYDIELDEASSVEVLIREMVTVICQKERCICYEGEAPLELYSQPGGYRLDPKASLRQNGVKDGQCVLLV